MKMHLVMRMALPVILVASCGQPESPSVATSATSAALEAPVVVAIMGDYGRSGAAEQAVANLITGWHPTCIVTTGDNNYPTGAANTLDENIGRYYHPYIRFDARYRGRYQGMGAGEQAFFAGLGNHDWLTRGAAPFLAYFALPGNERYYAVRRGALEIFVVDSDPQEPDGVSSQSRQGQWLQQSLSRSDATWKIVALHHPPFSTGVHGDSPWMRWPYKTWGATAVVSGHDHHYERLHVNGLPYFVVGTGGAALRGATGRHPYAQGDLVRTGVYGALKIVASKGSLQMSFHDVHDKALDRYTIVAQ